MGNHKAHRSIETFSQVDTLLGAVRGIVPAQRGPLTHSRMDSHGTAADYPPLTLASDATGK